MSISSLTKFTVPLASDQSASSQGLLMPKLKYRFRASFEGFGVSGDVVELTKQVVTFGRPSVSFEDLNIPVYNSTVKLIGKPSWADIKVTLRDDAVGNVSKLVGEQMQKQFDFMEQSSASSGIDYKFVTRLEMLDGGNGEFTPNVLETWEIYGCLIKEVAYGDVDYGSNDAVTLDLTLRYDNAVQTPAETGIGTNVGRTLGTNVTQ